MRRQRPASVLTVAILHLVGGGLGLFCNLCAGINNVADRAFVAKSAPPPGTSEQDRVGWTARQRMWKEVPAYGPYLVANISLSLVLAVALIVLGVGLLYLQRWAWFGTLGYCFLALLHKLFLAAYLLAVFVPTMNGIIGQEAGRMGQTAQQAGFTFGFKFGLFASQLYPLLFGVYPLVVLLVLLRPSVMEAFRPRQRARRRRDYDEDWDPEDD